MPAKLCWWFRGIAIGLAAATLWASSAAAQDTLYTNTFQGAKEGAHPEGWQLFGLDKPEYWYAFQGTLCTGNGDNEKVDGFAILSDPKGQSWTDYSIQCEFWMGQTQGRVYLAGRWQNQNNYYMGVLATVSDTSRPGGSQIVSVAQIVKVENGQPFVLNEVADGKNGVVIPKFTGGTTSADKHDLALELVGPRLTLYMDRKPLVTAQDATFTKGTCGLGQRENLVFFDNVLVVPVKAGAAAPPTSAAPMPGLPPVAGPGTLPTGAIYRLAVMEGIDRATAERVRADLVAAYPSTAVEVVQEPNGTHSVLYGVFLSEQEAQEKSTVLTREEGLTIKRVVQMSGQQAVQTFQQASAPGGRDNRFRVVAQAFPDPGTADQMKQALEQSGYFPVEVSMDAGQYRVLCGPPFINRLDAEALGNDLKETGYFAATVAEVRAEAASGVIEIVDSRVPRISPEDLQVFSQRAGYQATPEELKRVKDIVDQQRQAVGGGITGKEYQDIVDQIKNLTKEQKTILDMINQSEEQRRQKDLKAREYKIQVEAAQDQNRYADALEILKKWDEMDPGNPAIPIKTRIIENLMKGTSEVGGEVDRRLETLLQRKVAQARQEEQNGNLREALTLWTQVRTEAPPTSKAYADAIDASKRINDELEKRRIEQAEAAKQQKTVMYMVGAGIVLLVVFVAAIMIVMMMKSRRRDQELLRQVQELTVRPLKELEGGTGPKLLEGDERVEPVAARQTAAAQEKPTAKPAAPPAPARAGASAKAPAADLDKMRIMSPEEPPVAAPAKSAAPGGEPPAAKKPAVAPEAPPALEPWKAPELPSFAPTESVAAGAGSGFAASSNAPVDLPPLPAAEEEREPEAISAGGDHHESFLDIPSQDDLTALLTGAFDEAPSAPPPSPPAAPASPPKAARPAAPPVPPAPVPAAEEPREPVEAPRVAAEAPKPGPVGAKAATKPSGGVLQPEVVAAPPPVGAPAAVEAPAEAPAAAGAGDGKLVFAQDFDDEKEGAKPNNWTGDYDYSSLVVSSQTPAPDSKHCLRFEKRQGSGSAYYSCRFPEVGGRLLVEFDLRCDDKNKYLLGFYIEKDEDFRQSIHTIVHRTSPQVSPTLRVQGEPTQYSLGTWRHMKYEIDLNANSVNGYVDGELVAENVKLASPPKSINTLSIRDNLATTGVLLIDNIKILRL